MLIVFSWERIYNTETYYFAIFLHLMNTNLERFDQCIYTSLKVEMKGNYSSASTGTAM